MVAVDICNSRDDFAVGYSFILALLPDCQSDGVQQLLNRLNEIQITTSESRLPVAFSSGWANYGIGYSVADVLKRADAALYVNKRRAKGSTATLPDSEQEASFLRR
jgi:GGDEF domain-containing protein